MRFWLVPLSLLAVSYRNDLNYLWRDYQQFMTPPDRPSRTRVLTDTIHSKPRQAKYSQPSHSGGRNGIFVCNIYEIEIGRIFSGFPLKYGRCHRTQPEYLHRHTRSELWNGPKHIEPTALTRALRVLVSLVLL